MWAKLYCSLLVWAQLNCILLVRAEQVLTGMTLITFMLDGNLPALPAVSKMEGKAQRPTKSTTSLVAVLAVLREWKMLWLVPLQAAGGFMSSFITADFTGACIAPRPRHLAPQ